MSKEVTIEDVLQLFKESERVMLMRHKESERVMLESHIRLEESHVRLEESQTRLSKKVEDVSTQVGNLGSRWGEFVEGLIAPACLNLFTERGIPVDEVYTRAKKSVGGEHMEIDLMVVNTAAAVLVEVKSHLTVDDVKRHIEKLQKFKAFFPRYAACRVYGAVAGIAIASDADRFAINQGLFVIVQSGDTVELANKAEFEPKFW